MGEGFMGEGFMGEGFMGEGAMGEGAMGDGLMDELGEGFIDELGDVSMGEGFMGDGFVDELGEGAMGVGFMGNGFVDELGEGFIDELVFKKKSGEASIGWWCSIGEGVLAGISIVGDILSMSSARREIVDGSGPRRDQWVQQMSLRTMID
ncbi:hypothetical protein JR316_0006502 [Psilocybe cubensis]|uniref:Uncharacterized protein n=1 Tax=Psilocybe cubensis TaxID=181762 RepID=A0ACB8H2P8_PSICU|nr:hypothetical protein JR316_0006502 [Psilocybe cubensis]KAH9481972.1 hypothetical protein JR316_0006502 [Psilocybe cubensis]